jgi:hypothetical protein
VKPTKQKRIPFPGLRLSAKDQRALKQMTSGRKRVSARIWRRIRILTLLERGWNLKDTASAVGTYPREVRRAGWRYLDGGLDAAMSDDPRPKPSKMLDAKQEAAIVAMVCSPPPDGTSRWTVVLTAREAKRRGIVEEVGRETVRGLLANHDLKPWREKNVVRAETGPAIHRADGGCVGPPEQTAG